jgi:hypothetical protein
MIPDDRTENMEPPDCNRRDDDWFCEQCGSLLRDDATDYCPDCQRERDEINGIYENGTEETATIRVGKFRTTDGRGTCGLDFAHDHLRCPLIRAISFGRSYQCAWTGYAIFPDKSDGSGYLRPCENCPIHKSP